VIRLADSLERRTTQDSMKRYQAKLQLFGKADAMALAQQVAHFARQYRAKSSSSSSSSSSSNSHTVTLDS